MLILIAGRQAILRALVSALPRIPTFPLPSTAICSALSPPTVLSPVAPSLWGVAPCRTYVVRDILTLRCDGCYFAKRQGIRYVECRLRPRHKQKQKIRTKHWCWSNWNLRNVW
ncbi:hypothetical protein RvY_14476 [Ramazzottius varieornatus]|uniref:Large ribosomal subunit protein bL36m n=1 Tax=Ramazzottius varieornatus TaxID=947166 RepID=A0A1D1VRH1_RAMVA|nr:hypothetical protein RvY_14476 [Ramazzottius varieornatus]